VAEHSSLHPKDEGLSADLKEKMEYFQFLHLLPRLMEQHILDTNAGKQLS
jgi:hypothetical protein